MSTVADLLRGAGNVAGVVGKGYEGYGVDQQLKVKGLLAKAQSDRESENDRIMNQFRTAQTNELTHPAPKPHEYRVENGQRVDLTDNTAAPIAGYTAPIKPTDYKIDNGQRIDVERGTATPIAGYVAPVKAPSDMQEASIAARKGAMVDRLHNEYQQEPAIQQAGKLSNAVVQLRASAAQKTPQGDLNMLYGAVKLRDPNAVREGELKLNDSARSVFRKAEAFWNKISAGQILTDNERNEVMALVDQTVDDQTKVQAPVQARFGQRARDIKAQGDSAFIAPDMFAGTRPASQAPAKAAPMPSGLGITPATGKARPTQQQYDAAIAKGHTDADIAQHYDLTGITRRP